MRVSQRLESSHTLALSKKASVSTPDTRAPRDSASERFSLADIPIYAPSATDALRFQRAPTGAAAIGPAQWIVDDEAPTAVGQMRRRAFVAALDVEVHAAADHALAPIGRDSKGCAYIRRLLAHVGRQPAAAIERLARRYAATDATSALDYLSGVTAQIQRGVVHWIATGKIPTDVPDEQTLYVDGETRPDGPADLAFARAGAGGDAVAPITDQAALKSYLGPGTPLGGATRAALEHGFGTDLGGVRVHEGAAASALTRDLRAHAVTVGNDIAFAPAAYAPDSERGQALLAHEVAHTLQQCGAHGPIEGIGDAEHEHDADEAARIALTRAYAGGDEAATPQPTKRLRLQRCGDGGTTTGTPGPTATTKPSSTTKPTTSTTATPTATPSSTSTTSPPSSAAATALAGVVSEQIVGYEKSESKALNNARKRLATRVKRITELSGMTAYAKHAATLLNMKSRYNGTIVSDPTFDPVTGTVTKKMATDLRASMTADVADAATIGSAPLTEAISDATAGMNPELETYLTQHEQVAEERLHQFNRFDSDFLSADVVKALADAKADFRPADLKAMLGKESADFTNTAVAGLEKKTAGITTSHVNTECTSCIGIAQMQPGALTQATAQAGRIGITAPASSKTHDPRETPSEAILLAALYVADLARQLRAALPAPQPTGSELKNFVLAAYNGGASATGLAAEAYQKATKKTAYTWAEVSGSTTAMKKYAKPKDVKDYVQRIRTNAP